MRENAEGPNPRIVSCEIRRGDNFKTLFLNTKMSWGAEGTSFRAVFASNYYAEKCCLRSTAHTKAFQPALRVQEVHCSGLECQKP